nr:zinc-binding dehydrogenase [Amycolatopsis sp. RTGN1]
MDPSTESLRDGVNRLTDSKGIDGVLDSVGGSLTGAALGALAVDGTLISIGYTASPQAEIGVTDLVWKNAHVHGFRFALFTPGRINAANTHPLDLAARKEISPLVDRVFPLDQATLTQRHLAESSPFGRW